MGVLAVLTCAGPAVAVAQDRDREFKILTIPTISGTTVVGNTLTASGGSWSSPFPWNTSTSWQWWRCSSVFASDCIVVGERATYKLAPEDNGKWIAATKVIISPVGAACNHPDRCKLAVSVPRGPITVAAAPPAPTPVATPVPTPEPPPEPIVAPAPTPVPTAAPVLQETVSNRVMRPAPVVRMRGVLSTNGALITSLTVKAPRAARLTVTCSGSSSCPAKRWSPSSRKRQNTRMVAFQRNLRAGTRLTITLTRQGFVGKRTVFKIRRGKAPLRSDSCLSAATGKVQKCPAG